MKSQDRVPERPPPAQAQGAASDSHREKSVGKIDLSHELLSVGDIRVDVGDGRDVLPSRDFAHSGGWPRGVVGDEIFRDSGGCNTAGLDHNGGRDKTRRRREESDTHVGERRWNRAWAPVSRGSAGQPAPIMAG